MLTSKAKLIVIGFVLFSLMLICPNACATEVNNPQMSVKKTTSTVSERTAQADLTEVIISRLDILLGFILGLFGTLFVDYLRKRRRMKIFREGARIELRQILSAVNALSINPDCKITIEKIRTWMKLMKEFDLSKATSPLGDHSLYENVMKKDFKEEDLVGVVEIHNAKSEERNVACKCQDLGRLSYNFIQNNISSLSLLPKKEQALLLNIIRRLDGINQKISSIDFSFKKTFDSGVTDTVLNRLRYNYLSNCKFISDYSFATAEEIACFLRQL